MQLASSNRATSCAGHRGHARCKPHARTHPQAPRPAGQGDVWVTVQSTQHGRVQPRGEEAPPQQVPHGADALPCSGGGEGRPVCQVGEEGLQEAVQVGLETLDTWRPAGGNKGAQHGTSTNMNKDSTPLSTQASTKAVAVWSANGHVMCCCALH